MISKAISIAIALVASFAHADMNDVCSPNDLKHYENVLKYMDTKNYDAALDELVFLTPNCRKSPEVTEAEAGSNAGICGLDMLSYIASFPSNKSPLQAFLNAVPKNVQLYLPACRTAQDLIEINIGLTPVDRVTSLGENSGNSLNLFMGILGAMDAGSAMLHNSSTAAADACSTNNVTDQDVIAMATGLNLVLTDVSALGSVFGDNINKNLQSLQSLCEVSMPAGACDVVSMDDDIWFDPVNGPLMLKGYRGILKSAAYGFGSCTLANPFTCCP